MKKLKILYVLNNLDLCNGIASYSMNYYRKIRKEIEIDFLISSDSYDSTYIEEILQNGDKVFFLPEINYKSLKSFIKEVSSFFQKNHKYDIIHCHTVNVGFFYMLYAKRYNIPVRILHAHATISSDKFINKIRNDMLQPYTNTLATHFFACSQMAGESVFKRNPFYVIKNAIDSEKFIFNANVREKMKSNLDLCDNFVVGTVGRITSQKNPFFIIDIFNEIKKMLPNAKLLYIGEGPLYTDIRKYIKKLSLQDSVIFLSNRKDVNKLYQAMDVFLLPSLYEGLPVVGIEAQCSDLLTLVSDTITPELKIIDSTQFLSLNQNPQIWALRAVESKRRRNVLSFISQSGYNIINEASRLIEIYYSLLEVE